MKHKFVNKNKIINKIILINLIKYYNMDTNLSTVTMLAISLSNETSRSNRLEASLNDKILKTN